MSRIERSSTFTNCSKLCRHMFELLRFYSITVRFIYFILMHRLFNFFFLLIATELYNKQVVSNFEVYSASRGFLAIARLLFKMRELIHFSFQYHKYHRTSEMRYHHRHCCRRHQQNQSDKISVVLVVQKHVYTNIQKRPVSITSVMSAAVSLRRLPKRNHAQLGSQVATPFSISNCVVPGIFAIELRRCSKLHLNFVDFGPPNLWGDAPPKLANRSYQLYSDHRTRINIVVHDPSTE